MSKNVEIKVGDALRILCAELEVKLEEKLKEASAIKLDITSLQRMFVKEMAISCKASPKPVKLDNQNEEKVYNSIGTGNSIKDIRKKSKVGNTALYSSLHRLMQKKLIKRIGYGIYARAT